MKFMFYKDQRRRALFYYFEQRRNALRSFYNNRSEEDTARSSVYKQILDFPRDSRITRFRNRCVLRNRPRSVYRQFGLSRMRFRKYIWEGKLVGIKKASW